MEMVRRIYIITAAIVLVCFGIIRSLIYFYLKRYGWRTEFKSADIVNATNNFSEEIRDGSQGSFGHRVFKGTLVAGRSDWSVAVKLLPSTVGAEGFRNAVNLFARIRHRNLVIFVGFSNHENDQMLVYEFMPKGSLHDALHGNYLRIADAYRSSDPGIATIWPRVLTWRERLEIVLAAAEALQYLHDNGVVHGDVSSRNILLAYNLEAKLADFGLNDLARNQLPTTSSDRGFARPDVFHPERPNDLSSVEKDVYGFGIVLLEVVSGKPAGNGPTHGGRQQLNLVDWVVSKSGRAADVADPRLQGNYDTPSMQLLLKVGLACVRPSTAAGELRRARVPSTLMTGVRDEIFRARTLYTHAPPAS